MTALGKLVRTTAFKLSAAYLVIFVVFAAFILGYVSFNARRLLMAQASGTVQAEIQGLAEQYNSGGMRRLLNIIERRSNQPGSSLYLLVGPGGTKLAGNIENLPDALRLEAGEHEITYLTSQEEETNPRPHQALVRVIQLPGGFTLLVGRDLGEGDRFRTVVRRAFGWSLGLVIVLALLGGWFVTSRVLGRIDSMTATTRGIMTGDLSGRLTVAGSNDEFDRLAENLNLMLDRIEELMQGLREVSDNIAHDLKTPLTRLRNGAEEALRTARTVDDYRGTLEATIEEADNLIRIFNALLMIARAEAGNSREGMVDFNIADVARDVAELYEPVADEAGIPLRVEVPADLPMHGSRELVGQAIANLVDNAIKYAAPAVAARTAGGPAVDVAIGGVRLGDMIEISVADRGPGIPAEDRVRVVERFVRLEGARTRPGFGLGLSLASAVARLHGGTLRLEDNAPGLRVVISLPERPELGPPAATDATSAKPAIAPKFRRPQVT
ncbi:MAG: ATP-binding protein [Alsobacter sp.]